MSVVVTGNHEEILDQTAAGIKKGMLQSRTLHRRIVTEPALSLQHISKSLATSPRWPT